MRKIRISARMLLLTFYLSLILSPVAFIMSGWPTTAPEKGSPINNILTSLRNIDDDEFGGFYFDENDPSVLHVNTLEGQTGILEYTDPSVVKVHTVRYSIAELDRMHSLIDDILGKYTIEFISRDEELNKLEIGVVDTSEENIEEICNVITNMGIDVSTAIYFSPATDHRECGWTEYEAADEL